MDDQTKIFADEFAAKGGVPPAADGRLATAVKFAVTFMAGSLAAPSVFNLYLTMLGGGESPIRQSAGWLSVSPLDIYAYLTVVSALSMGIVPLAAVMIGICRRYRLFRFWQFVAVGAVIGGVAALVVVGLEALLDGILSAARFPWFLFEFSRNNILLLSAVTAAALAAIYWLLLFAVLRWKPRVPFR